MFDSTPRRVSTPEKSNDVTPETVENHLARLRESRGLPLLYSPPAIPPTAPTLDLVASWEGDIAELRDKVDCVSNWGPYELVDCARTETDGRILCRFYYHGAKQLAGPDTEGQFEQALRASLDQITTWERAA